MTETSETYGWSAVLNRRYGAPVLLVCLGVWLHAADGLIVATMMPSIVFDIGGAPYVAWTVGLYEIGSIVAGASSGLIALRRGVRLPMIAAAIVFSLGCLISMCAPNMPILLVGRLIQGIGGGGLTALSFVATAVLFPAQLTARVMATMSVLWGASAFMGPMIGGVFVTYADWRYGFGFFAVQSAGLAVWILWGIHFEERAPKAVVAKIPLRRLALLSLGVLAITWAGLHVTPVRTPALVVLGLGLLGVFLWLDRNSGDDRLLPSVPLSLRDRVGAAGMLNLCLSMATMGLPTYGPLLLAMIHGTPPIVAGYVLAAVSIAWTVAAISVAGLPERHDPKMITLGFSIVVVSVAGMVWAVPNGPVWLVAVFAALEGLGFGMAWSFVIRRAKRLVHENEIERLSAAMPTIGRLGYALGAAWCGIWANAAGFALDNTAAQAAHVATVLFWACLPFAILGLIATLRFVSGRPV